MMKSSLNALKFSRAFSLVELLVVIAIISMMASLLFPAIESGIQKAQGVKCLSNLRQIGGGRSAVRCRPGERPSVSPYL